MILRIKHSHITVTILAILAIAVTLQHTYFVDLENSVSAVAKDQSPCDRALVYLLMDKIQKQSDDFYEKYYTVNPIISDYSTTVKEVKEVGQNLYITFTTLPYIGPHNTVGEDEITFLLNGLGEITPMGVKHLKNYALPDNLTNVVRGNLPPIAE